MRSWAEERQQFFRFHEFVKSKNLACLVGQITGTGPLSPRRHEGRFAVVTKRGAGCDGRCGVRRVRSLDVTLAAYGEVVWSWRRDRGVYFAGGIPQTTVTINAAHRGEHEGNRQTIARGKPV